MCVQIYSNRSQSETRRYAQLPQPGSDQSSAPVLGIQKITPNQTQQPVIPDIAPMRRGRPKASSQTDPVPVPKIASTDPFAALDSKEQAMRAAAADDLASKFPSLDEFSILHDRGTKFQFGESGQTLPIPADPKKEALHKRVTEALADEAFAKPTTTHTGPAIAHPRSPAMKPQKTLVQPTSRSVPAVLYEPIPQRPNMVSTGTMTSPAPSSPVMKTPNLKQRLWGQGVGNRSPKDFSRVRTQQVSPDLSDADLPPRPEPVTPRPNILERARTKSQTALSIPKSPASSRPSLEGNRPPTLEYLEPIDRSKSANARPRPSSLYVENNLDYLRGRESTRVKAQPTLPSKPDPLKASPLIGAESSDEEGPDDHITSDVDFLRSIESTEDQGKRRSRRSSSSSKPKRTSLPSISLTGTKNILAGRFGDAFRRFETNSAPSAEQDHEDHDSLRAPLSPIMGSEATGTSGRSDEDAIDETQDLPPEVRRELERRRLSQEEKRVANAAAEYKQRLAQGDKRAAAPSKASTIQNRVKNLLSDNNKNTPVNRTAEGYGRYTDVPKPAAKATTWRKPVPISNLGTTAAEKNFADPERQRPLPGYMSSNVATSSPLAAQAAQRTGPRPSPAPKPLALRTGGNSVEATAGRTLQEQEDWEANFSKKYPSLSGIEMVETEIVKGPGPRSVRDV